MQPSPVEIQREVEALRDIRRRSTTQGGPGALILDPDLPNESSPTGTSAGYWTPSSTPGLTDGDSSSSSHEDSSSSAHGSPDDPFHLFWVPARLHPEIAPTEFRAFLKEHARGPVTENAGASNLARSPSATSTSSGLGRRASMLSRQYRPKEADGVEDEEVLPLKRNRSSIYQPGPQLTISDLQKLEELAEEASASDDPNRLRSILRRSMSLNVSPSAMDTMDNMPDINDEADAPIIVPRPGQILRRAARTKIRKPGLPGDGGGHRFGATRRQTTGGTSGRAPPPPFEQRPSSGRQSNDHEDSQPNETPPKRGRVLSNESLSDGQFSTPGESFSEDASSIFDSYAGDDSDDGGHVTVAPSPANELPNQVVVSPPTATFEFSDPSPLPAFHIPLDPLPIPSTQRPLIHQPQPQRVESLKPPTQEIARSPSPDSLLSIDGAASNRSHSPGSEASSFISTLPAPKKDKDKKSGLFGFGRTADKGSKKGNKEKEKERERQQAERDREEEKKKEKEKESGFFGSLFGKKKQDEHASGSGRDSASLLGSPKSSRSYNPPISPQFTGTGGSYARYPIHVERAIYRLSHIKLANPRRPLYEQVLISNLMFWYLGVINKTQTPTAPTGSQPDSSPAEKEMREQEQKEAEERHRVEKEKERAERDKEKEKERDAKKESPRRGSLTKSPSAGAPGGRRAAEMPVRGPQYEMQHRVMEQEYGASGSGSGSMPARSNTMPIPINGERQSRSSQSANVDGYYHSGDQGRNSQGQLPPGAMAPVDQMSWLAQDSTTSPEGERRWHSPSPQSPPRNDQSHPGPPSEFSELATARRSRSPPAHNQNRFAPSPIHMPDLYNASLILEDNPTPPTRSRSATAIPSASQSTSPQQNGKVRKGTSAHAVMANGRKPRKSDASATGPPPLSPTNEGDDMPLAMLQSRRR